MLGLNIIVFPLLLVRDISSLRYFNLIGFISVFYTAAVITFEASSYHDYYFDEDKDSFKHTLAWIKEVKKVRGNEVRIILLGNKSDRKDQR